MRAFLCIVCLAGLFALPAQYADASELSSVVKEAGVDPAKSTLLIVRLSDDAIWTSNSDRLDEAFPPASTSKIPHTLIALETDLAKPDTTFAWDGTKRFAESWNQDQTLTSAYQRSAYWVYQQITASLGPETMSKWIKLFGYGNQNIGNESDLTTYWLLGPLEISARQQVGFLRRLVEGELPITGTTNDLARKIMQANQGDNWTLFAKTGWRSDGANQDIGWYVGWVERTDQGQVETYLFAFNMYMSGWKDRDKRSGTFLRALVSIGALPAEAIKQ